MLQILWVWVQIEQGSVSRCSQVWVQRTTSDATLGASSPARFWAGEWPCPASPQRSPPGAASIKNIFLWKINIKDTYLHESDANSSSADQNGAFWHKVSQTVQTSSFAQSVVITAFILAARIRCEEIAILPK